MGFINTCIKRGIMFSFTPFQTDVIIDTPNPNSWDSDTGVLM